MNTLVLEMNVLKTRAQTSATHTQLPTSDFQTNLYQDDRYSQVHVLTSENEQYHALVLTSEYTTPTSYIHVYAIAFSAGQTKLTKLIEKIKNKLLTDSYSTRSVYHIAGNVCGSFILRFTIECSSAQFISAKFD